VVLLYSADLMSGPSFRLRRTYLILGAVCLLAVGAGAAYIAISRAASSAGERSATPDQSTAAEMRRDPVPMPEPGQPLPDVSIRLTEDDVRGAGIVIGSATIGAVSSRITIAGTVEANTSQQVVVSAPAAGRLISVAVELGARVERGQPLAQMSSPELNEAQARFLAAQSTVKTRQEQLDRIEKLTGVGAVSRQELDRARADRAAAGTELDDARARLGLLGMSQEAIAALVSKGEVAGVVNVVAPSPGTIVQQEAAAGQNVDASTRLFTIADLSSVWIAGDLPETELARIHIGSPATVTVAALSNVLSGTVTFLDPQVNLVTHASRIRVELQNAGGELHPGMTAAMEIGDPGTAQATLVPREALQMAGDRQVVYVANAGEFIEREVRVGAAAGDQVVVLSGVKAGDQIAVKGSTFLRSERERLGLRAPTAAAR
jgi:cobalt-zinc-cadmium efflux system membrane fusion protein